MVCVNYFIQIHPHPVKVHLIYITKDNLYFIGNKKYKKMPILDHNDNSPL